MEKSFAFPLTPGSLRNEGVLRLKPGAGSLLIPVKERIDFERDTDRTVMAVEDSVPLLTSYGRLSPFLDSRSSRSGNMVLAMMRREVELATKAFCKHVSNREDTPIINMRFLKEWLPKMGMDKERELSQLGVIKEGDLLVIGETPKGGRYFYLYTDERDNREFLCNRWGERIETEKSRKSLWEFTIDVAMLTGMALANRLLIYYQVSRQLDWFRVLQEEKRAGTIHDGLCPITFWLHHNSVVPKPKSVFSAWSGGEVKVCLPTEEEQHEWPLTEELPARNRVIPRIAMSVTDSLSRSWDVVITQKEDD